MFGEQYQVDYIINLQDNASAGIMAFSRAASKLANATKNFKQFEERFSKMTATFNKQLELKISTSQASRKLNRVIKQLERIDGLAKGINLGVAGGVSQIGGAANRRNTATPVAAPVPRQPRVSQPQGPRPLVAPRGRQPLVPRNLEYQVLGPTRLGNVAMLDMFKGMGLMYGISAIGSGVRDIISQSTEYENIMQTAKNILKTNYKGGNFNVSFNDMERIVREVGVETKFTAPEVADAVKFLAMAGLDINAITKSIRPIADIALIGDTDLGQTADVMTNIMTAYGIKPDDMRKTADVMTRTFTMSNTTLLELAESFKMAGSMLHLANVPFETAAAAFGVLGDAGIKATMAGTTMRTIMNNLRNPTKNQQKYWDMLGIRRFDEYGNLREINEIFADLNKLNSNDARSAEAKRRYDELQKQFAPRFEGLQEGSIEYNKVLAEYDKESDAIRKQFGGVDVFRLFRLTAASGAGVLMNSVEKWNRIIEENFLSQGLSNRLAEEKKNTIAGMWAQLKSAFQEGGLKVFEENDSRVRGYLQKGIAWLKTDQFTDMLRSVIDLVADLGEMLLKFTKRVVELYEKFKPAVNLFLKFQLVMKGIQVVLGSMKMVWNALLYAGSPFFTAFTSSPMAQRRWPGLFGFSNAYAAAAANAQNGGAGVGAGSAIAGMNPMLAWWAVGRKGKGMPMEPVTIPQQNLAPYTQPNMPLNPTQMTLLGPVMSQQANANYKRQLAAYNKRVARANQMQRNAGWASIGGAMAGAYFGSAIAPESEWGATIGGAVGSLGSMALAAAVPGAGWIAAAVMAATAVTAYFIKQARAAREAKDAADAYYESMNRLNVEQWRIGNEKDYFSSMLSIRSNNLLTEQERLKGSITLWNKYYAAMKGEDEEFDRDRKGGMVALSPRAKELYEGMTGEKGGSYRNELRSRLTAEGKMQEAEQMIQEMFSDQLSQIDLKWYELLGIGSGAKYHDNLYKSLNSDAGLYFIGNVLDKNNDFLSGEGPVAKWLASAYSGLGAPEDIETSIQDFATKFLMPAGEFKTFREQDETKLEDIAEMSPAEWLQFPTYYALMKPMLQKRIEDFVANAQRMLSGDEAEAQRAVQGFYMQHQIFPYLGEGYDNFLSPEFAEKFSDLANIPGKNELDKRAKQRFAFEQLVKLFEDENISDIQKKYLLPMLNRTYWENTLGVDLSGIEGGFVMPTSNEPKPYGDMFNWDANRGVYTYEDGENTLWSLPGVKNFMPGRSVGNVTPWSLPSFNDMFDWDSIRNTWMYKTGGQNTEQSQYSYMPFYQYNPYTGTGENIFPQPALPSTRAVNEALALAESGIKVQPNVTKNNTYTFTFQIENLRTDMDEDQLSQFIDERFIPSVIDKLDHSFEGSLSA